MYTLYYSPGACSLATQVILRELQQDVNIVNKSEVADYKSINPTGAVPVLVDDGQILREGAALMIYLLDKHRSPMLPAQGTKRHQAIENIMFANATMHPAYSRLFFIAQHITDEQAKQQAFGAATDSINSLWQIVDQRLEQQDFLGGDQPSAADVMLAVYSRWGQFFPVEIELGKNTERMINAIFELPSFQQALAAEAEQAAAA